MLSETHTGIKSLQMLHVACSVCQKSDAGRLRHCVQQMLRIGNETILQQAHRQTACFLLGKKSATLGVSGNRLGRTGHAHVSFFKNDHVVAKRRFVHVCGRHHDKHVTRGRIFAQDAPQIAARKRVDTDRRLVQKQDTGTV